MSAATTTPEVVSRAPRRELLGRQGKVGAALLTLIVGTAAIIRPVGLDRATQLFSFPAMLVMMALLVCMMLSGQRLSRREGAIVPLVTSPADADRLCVERHVCIDTTAAGGNASLMSAAQED